MQLLTVQLWFPSVKSVLPFIKGQIYSHLTPQPIFNVKHEKIMSTHGMIEKLLWDMTKKKCKPQHDFISRHQPQLLVSEAFFTFCIKTQHGWSNCQKSLNKVMNAPEIQSIIIDREAWDMNEGFPAVLCSKSGRPPLKHTPPQPTIDMCAE